MWVGAQAFAFVVSALPIVVVERAPDCPDAALLVADLANELPDDESRAAGGQHRLRVDERSVEALHVELTDSQGHVELVREVVLAEATCAAKSRAVAVVVERWWSALTVSPGVPVASTPSLRTPTRARVRSEPRLAARASAAVSVGIGPPTAAGLGVGLAARIVDRLSIALEGLILSPSSVTLDEGHASVLRGSLRVRAALVLGSAGARFEAGPSLHLDWMSVSSSGGAPDGSSARAVPGAGLALGGSLPLARGVRAATLLEAWVAAGTERFYVMQAGGARSVFRSARSGLALELALVVDLF